MFANFAKSVISSLYLMFLKKHRSIPKWRSWLYSLLRGHFL